MTTRCGWAIKSPELMTYHDTRWGKPTREVQELFTAMCLEIMQAGLTFQTVLKFEDGMNQVFHHFSIKYLAELDDQSLDKFCQDKRVIRNRAKIAAIIANAKVVANQPARFVDQTWAPVHYVTLDHMLTQPAQPENYQTFISPFVKSFKSMGLKRMGPITTYSYLQAVGVINDHLLDCEFR